MYKNRTLESSARITTVLVQLLVHQDIVALTFMESLAMLLWLAVAG